MACTSTFPLIEVCVDSLDSALAAVAGGADRLELCANLGVGGGTTPSIGLLRSVQKMCAGVPVMVLVRPRMGDFVYTQAELTVMAEDIYNFKRVGVAGIVIGVVDEQGMVNTEATKRLVKEASPLEVCFHRAFDMTVDADSALHDVSQIGGITRILTSGLGKSALTSLKVLKDLVHQTASQGPTILPGSGINASNVREILEVLLPLGLREVHLSGGGWVPSQMCEHARRVGMGMGVGESEWGIWRTSEKNIREVRGIVDMVWREFSTDSENS